ncbi:hypothetical protein LCM02_05135 [Lutimonas saemankumensis]|uniref:hypothetical protein n=1 Tax=Lutimonas saemankumensis TaxID=483016 RepID=UPI001CD25486|nr:hypothetical protein [Lutimonas saemankumensis]MCA0931826.1 hypothetical protein [Lutimonas saemankumensis]
MNALSRKMNPRNDRLSTTATQNHSLIKAFDLTSAAEAVNGHLNRFIVILLIPCMALYEAFYRNGETGRVLAFLYLILVAFRSWFLLVKSSVNLEEKVNRSFLR